MLSRARSRARSWPASATVAQDAPEGERGHGGWPDYREALYAKALADQTSQAIDYPARLIVPMVERFIAAIWALRN